MTSSLGGPLLAADDPPPVSVYNREGRARFLLMGDHAGNAIPRTLGMLGLSEADRSRHIAWDIGTAALGKALADRLDAVFIHQIFSRLVIDCNRAPTSIEAILGKSDGTEVPGNQDLSQDDTARRVAEIHAPYQAAIRAELLRRAGAEQETVLISLHSFTPVMNGVVRPWEIGVLHGGGSAGFALSLLAALATNDAVVVGDNEPYRMDDTDYTVPIHAFPANLPYAEIEVRQDQLERPGGIECWADLLSDALTRAEVAAYRASARNGR